MIVMIENQIVNYEKTGNIIKGFSIIMVVIGHTPSFLSQYFYTCHLALFFFVLGYHYNSEKYQFQPLKLFTSRLISIWPKYFFYQVCFILFHNLFLDFGFYSIDIERYSFGIIVQRIMSAFVFQDVEQMGGAMWFISMFLINIAIYDIIFVLSNKYTKNRSRTLIIIFLLIALIALVIEYKGVVLPYSYHLGLKYLPIAFLGYLGSDNKARFLNKFNFIGTGFALLMLIYLITVRGLGNVYIFGNLKLIFLYYPMTIFGLYIIIYASKVIARSKFISSLIIKIGNYSFDIMALHFLTFKIVDYIYIKVVNPLDANLSLFPTSFSNLIAFYSILGVLLPVMIAKIINKMYSNIVD